MDNKEEVNLFALIRQRDHSIASLFLESTLIKMQQMDKLIKINNYSRIPIPGIIDSVCFRIKFRSPLFFLVSPQISYFKTITKYYKCDIGFLPTYLTEINDITLFKTWDYFANDLLGPVSSFPIGYTCWKTTDDNTTELSSMNFILRNDSRWKQENNEQIVNFVIKHFKFLYWNIPKTNQVKRNILLYHNYYKIFSTYYVNKTLFIVEEVKNSETIDIGYKKLRLRRASVSIFFNPSVNYEFKSMDCFITEDILNTISHSRKLLLNGLLTTIRIDNLEHKILSSITASIQNSDELVNTIVGIVAAERFNLSGNLTLGMMKEFEKQVFRICDRIINVIDNAIFYNLGLSFDKSMAYLFPTIIPYWDDYMYYIHPSILGMLAHFNKTEFLNKVDLLIDIVKILDQERQEARFSEEADNIQKAGINKMHLLNYVNVINDSIRYSRILKK